MCKENCNKIKQSPYIHKISLISGATCFEHFFPCCHEWCLYARMCLFKDTLYFRWIFIFIDVLCIFVIEVLFIFIHTYLNTYIYNHTYCTYKPELYLFIHRSIHMLPVSVALMRYYDHMIMWLFTVMQAPTHMFFSWLINIGILYSHWLLSSAPHTS